MKKPFIITLIAIAVVAAGVGVFVFFSQTNNAENPQNENATVSTASSETTGQASIEDLLSRNASLACSYSVTTDEGVSTGTAYFARGKNMYGEFTNTANGEVVTANVIRNGDTQYVWTKDSTTGIKNDVSASNKETQQQASQQFDPDQKFSFTCVDWNRDDSFFVPPATVSFFDISAQS